MCLWEQAINRALKYLIYTRGSVYLIIYILECQQLSIENCFFVVSTFKIFEFVGKKITLQKNH